MWLPEGYPTPFHFYTDYGTSPEEMVFYQRAYDRRTLESRLLNPSPLEIVDVSFWGERRFAVEHYLGATRVLRYAMLPLHFPLSQLFLRELTEHEPSRKKVLLITLRKPAR